MKAKKKASGGSLLTQHDRMARGETSTVNSAKAVGLKGGGKSAKKCAGGKMK